MIHIPLSTLVVLWGMSSPPTTIPHTPSSTQNTFHWRYYRAGWGLSNEHKIFKICQQLAVVNKWRFIFRSPNWLDYEGYRRDVFTANDHTACTIIYIKYFPQAVLQSWISTIDRRGRMAEVCHGAEARGTGEGADERFVYWLRRNTREKRNLWANSES